MAYGTLALDTIQSSTAGTPPQFNDGNGTQIGTLCRAWVNFAGASGIRNGNFNVSSVTRNGTGNYTINFASAMPDTNYAVNGNIQYSNATGGAVNRTCQVPSGGLATGSVQVLTGIASTSTLEDEPSVFVSVFR